MSEQLVKLAERQVKAEADLERAENSVKIAARDLAEIRETLIPDLMDEMELSSFTSRTGVEVKIQDSIRANISPKDPVRMVKAMKWLRDMGFAKLIKNKIEILANSDDEAQSVVRYLSKFPDQLDFSEMPSVHPSTLSSWVNKRMLAGEEVDEELLGVYNRRFSKVKVP